MSAPAYEFTEEQNAILAHLASRMRVVGWVLISLAVLAIAHALLATGAGSAIGIEVGIVLALLGGWSARAGTAFSRVVTTKGSDVTHLMRALGDIRKLYDLQFWIFVGIAALLAATLLVAMTGWGPIPTAW